MRPAVAGDWTQAVVETVNATAVLVLGLEVGLGLVFLWPVVKRSDITFALHSCLVIHSGLVLFRSISFFCYTGFETATYALAAIEWTILVFSAILFIRHRTGKRPGVRERQ